MTLHDCGMALLHPHARELVPERPNGPRRLGNPHPNLAPYAKFPTRTCEIFVAAGNDGAVPQARARCWACRSWPDDPRFATNAGRLVNRDALTGDLGARFADEDGHEI